MNETVKTTVYPAADPNPSFPRLEEAIGAIWTAEKTFQRSIDRRRADNAPEWKRLFVQGVGNYLQGFTGHTPLSRERASQLEAFMNDTSSSVGRFMGEVARSVAQPNRLGKVFGRKAVTPAIEHFVEEARKVTRDEQDWLDEQIEANGQVDEYDCALLDFLAEEA